MNEHTNKKVICVKDIPSNLIEEAIFILKSDDEIAKMEEENALPHGWEKMTYEDFLLNRRKLMAAKIKAGFIKLNKE